MDNVINELESDLSKKSNKVQEYKLLNKNNNNTVN
jgi:hypothetical protein